MCVHLCYVCSLEGMNKWSLMYFIEVDEINTWVCVMMKWMFDGELYQSVEGLMDVFVE